MNWKESFNNYAIDIAKIYAVEPEKILLCLKFESVTESLNTCYNALVSDGSMPRIEELPKDRKTIIWNQSASYGEGNAQRIAVSKSIYLLEMLTK